MNLSYSEFQMVKLLLPLLAALLIGQFFLLISAIWFSSWFFMAFLIAISFLADIIEQERKSEAPLLINILFVFIVYLAGNLILIKQKDLSLTVSNLFYQRNEMSAGFMVLLATFWGMSHGNMLSSLRAYWSFDTNELSTQREEAFSPPAMVMAIKRCLLLGFFEHLFSWYYKLLLYQLLLFWVLAFSYLGLMQFWGLSLNVKSIGLSIPSNITPLWRNSLFIFIVLIIALAVLLPKNILTIKEERLSEGIVNLLSKVHYRQSENSKDRTNIFKPLTKDEYNLEGTYFQSESNLTGWLFIAFFLVQLIIVVLVPALFIMGIIGWLLYNVLQSEYNRLEGLPRFFVRFYLWFKQLVQFRIKRVKKADVVWLKEEKRQVISPRKLKKKQHRGTIYERLIRACQTQGLIYRKSQTPFEYSTQIAKSWPVIGDRANAITVFYVAKKYGKRQFNTAKTNLYEDHLKSIIEFFKITTKENTYLRQEIPRL